MQVSRKDERGSGSMTRPLLGIVALLAFYWLVADWHDLPDLIGSTITHLHIPR